MMSGSTSHRMYVDAHCHVDLFPSPQSIVAEAARNRVHTIAVTNAPSVFFHTRDLCVKSQFVHAALGLHPELVGSHGSELPLFLKQLPSTRFVGEIGLDHVSADEVGRMKQRHVFEQILGYCAESTDKVLTIHSRRAATDVIAMVGDNFPGAIILHWFSGSKRELDQAINYGLYFSVNPAMVKSKSGREVIGAIPSDRLLTETDAPFVRSERGDITPSAVRPLVSELAIMRGLPCDQLQGEIMTNWHVIMEGKGRT